MKPRGDRRSRRKRTVYGHANKEYRSALRVDEIDEQERGPYAGKTPLLIRDQKRSSVELPPGRWPSLRIIRAVDVNAVSEGGFWREFLDDFADRNRGKGRVLGPGSMVCEFVGSAAMMRMLNDKYPRAFEERKKALELTRRFARGFNQFARRQERVQIDQAYERMSSGIARHMLDTADDRGQWGYSVLRVKGLGICDDHTVGLDLGDNEVLYKEWEGVRGYLEGEGLNTAKLRDHASEVSGFSPLVGFFETTNAAGAVALQYAVERPGFVPLENPHAQIIPDNC